MRNEFGYPRTTCACTNCQTNCRFMPGFLIPSDLERLIPSSTDSDQIETWARQNLLASPGALVMQAGKMFRIPTLVPATKPDGSCVHLSEQGLCQIHENAPFGCAFFDCGPERGKLSHKGLAAVADAWQQPSLYSLIWRVLWESGLRQQPPDVLRSRMREQIEGRSNPQ